MTPSDARHADRPRSSTSHALARDGRAARAPGVPGRLGGREIVASPASPRDRRGCIRGRLEGRGVGRVRMVLLVMLGGTAGTALRACLESAFGAPAGTWPWVTFWINVTGSLLLGFLQEALLRSGADSGWRRNVRLGIGTGLIGGYTTYSTFIVEVDGLLGAGATLVGVAYAVTSVALGIACALAGVLLARRMVVRAQGGGQ